MVWADPVWLFSATTFAIALIGTPGPNTVMLTASGANFGLRRTVPHMAGIAVGFPGLLLIVGLAGSAVMAHPEVQMVLKWGGGAYLLWLAWKIATLKPVDPTEAVDAGAELPASKGSPLSFLQALAFQVVNPKAWVGVVAAVANFGGTGEVSDRIVTVLVLTALFFLASLPLLCAWTLVGVGTAHVLKSARAMRLFNLTMAALLVMSLAMLAVL